jgi:hypothetical protein
VSAFERWRSEGLNALAGHLRERGASEAEAARVTAQLAALPAPGWIALLAGAGPGSAEPRGGELVRTAAAAVAAEAGTDVATAARVLGEILRGDRAPREIVADDALRQQVLERGIEEALEAAGVPATPAEIRRIAALLETGEFFGDLGGATAAVLEILPHVPLAIARDVGRAPQHVPRVVAALAADLGEAPGDVAAALADLADGRPESPPVRLTRTLRVLFEVATLAATAQTVRTWLDPENETVRLAILLYARAHGLPLEPDDLDAVRTALDAANPDLGPLWIAAWDHLEARLGPPGLAAVLASLGGRRGEPGAPDSASERQRQ